ncbi:MAG TPA: carboxypeptidase-like regulatory domain-containing protein [Bryobacteraceae bacterium]|nr:carboxypeptidase-like regulatory domain-containing protein [Bryobacteraceae bacterium]
MKLRIFGRGPVLPLVLLAFIARSGFTQDSRGQILGRVLDPSGAAVVGASVKVVNIETTVQAVAKTGQTGDYLVPFLNPGNYTLAVEATGFKPYTDTGILVRTGDKVTINVNLTLGGPTESIEVTGAPPLVDLSSADVGKVIDSRRISQLPTLFGNPMGLVALAPGVTTFAGPGTATGFDYTQYTTDASNKYIASGSAGSGNNQITLDGAPNTEGVSVSYSPPVDLVQEMKVDTSSVDVSKGFTMGAYADITMKSGTNQYHGSLLGFVQNTVLNANSFFSNLAGLPKSPTRFARAGATFGGPVFIPHVYHGQGKTFFMFGYDMMRQADNRGTVTTTVPTMAERNGDFSALLRLGSQYQIYDPLTTAPAPNGRFSRQPFLNNTIPASRINPVSAKLADLWPAPNLPGNADGSANWTSPGPETQNYFTYSGRIDHSFSERNRIFLRGQYGGFSQEYGVQYKQAQGLDYDRDSYNLGVDEVYVLGPNFLLNARASVTHFIIGQSPVARQLDLSALGFSQQFLSQINSVSPAGVSLPVISISDGYGFSSSSQYVSNSVLDDYVGAVNFTRTILSHTLRFGAEMRTYRSNVANLGLSSGRLNFDRTYTNGPLDNSPAAPLGQSFTSFLLGIPGSASIDANDSYAEQSKAWALYLGDDFKVSKRLTLTVGVREEFETPTTERFNRAVSDIDSVSANPIQAQAQANYATHPIPQIPADQFKVLGGLLFAGVNGQPRSLHNGVAAHTLPRVGLVFSINPKTVLRASYGMYYDLIGITTRSVTQAGFNKTTQAVVSTDNGQTYLSNIYNPFGSVDIQRGLGAAGGLSTNVGQSISAPNPNLKTPYAQRWQIGVERQISHDVVVQVSYVGNRSTDLIMSRNLNATPAQYLSISPFRDQTTINALTAQVPNPFYPLLPGTSLSGQNTSVAQLLSSFPEFTSVNIETNQGYSWYHSLQATIEKRFSHGVTIDASFTQSKYMAATGLLNASDPMPVRAISSSDRPTRFTFSPIYEFPFGKGRRFLSSSRGVLNVLVSGWQTGGMWLLQSGPPLGFGNAIFLGDLKNIALASDQRSINEWFNVNAGFERNSTKQLADNIIALSPLFSGIRGDGLNWWNLSFIKDTNITEKCRVQFRVESANAFNHPKFAAPNTSPSSSSFGKVTAIGQAPRTIQFGLKVIF